MHNYYELQARLAGLPVTEEVKERDRLRNEILEDAADQTLTEADVTTAMYHKAGIKPSGSRPNEKDF